MNEHIPRRRFLQTVPAAGALACAAAAQTPMPVTLVPYHLWANRGAGEMSVWLPRRELAPGDTGLAGGFICYVNPNHINDCWQYLEASPFNQSGGAKWGCFRREIAGARGTTDILAACDEPGSAAYLCAHFVLNGIGGDDKDFPRRVRAIRAF